MPTVAEAIVVFMGDMSKLDKDFDSAEKKTQNSVGNMAKMLGGGLVAAAGVAGAAIVGIGTKGLESFIAFEEQMNEVFTLLPGISQDAMADMTDQVKDFSKEFGVLPDEVVPALYQALSAGVPVNNVFEFLGTAAKAAAGGVTELETSVDGISSVVNAYGADVLSATQASDLMFTTVRLGKTNFEELSASLFNVVPTAASLGVQFEEVTAALAAMTLQGVPTSVATTQLRQLLVELSKDGGKAALMFEQLAGKSFVDFVEAGGSVAEALTMMEEGAIANDQRLSDLFGSVEAGNAALALTGQGAETFANDLTAMGQAAGATEGAFQTMEGGIGDALGDLKALWATTMLEIGGALAPLIEENLPLLESTAKTVSEVVVSFFQKIPPAIAEVKKKWDEDWAGMRTTIDTFVKEVPVALQGMWTEIDNTFRTEGDETGDGWEKIWRGMSTFFTGWVLVVINSWTEAWRTWQAIQTTFTGLMTYDWELFWNGMRDFVYSINNQWLNWVEFTFGPDLRNAFVGAMNGAWDGMKDVWENIQEWWDNTIGSLLNSAPDYSSLQPPAYTSPPMQITPPNWPQNLDQGMGPFASSTNMAAPLAGTTNNITVNLANGGYDQGFLAGDGVLDAMHFQGIG